MGHDKNQPARADNIAAIVKYFADGIKDKCDAVGIELEHTLTYKDKTPVSYSDEFGQKALLEAMSNDYSEQIRTPDGSLIGLLRDGESVTLEPGSQVEISAGPFENLHEAKSRFLDFERRLEEATSPHGIEVLATGYHPTKRAAELELLPKPRYGLMNSYLGGISKYGICMMRGSASTQVSIDYSSVDDCLRKMRLANACVPMLSLICDNSPVFEGQPRKHPLVRTEIWNKCDPDRCGMPTGAMSSSFSLESYAEYVLDTPAIVATGIGATSVETTSPCTQTFGEMFANETMTQPDIEHALSMLFTDVRLKRYIEIRPADAMPVNYAIAYAALIKGLFYSETSLDALDSLFAQVCDNDVTDAKTALMSDGYSALVYGTPASKLADELASIASAGLARDEADLLEPLATLIAKRTTLASITERIGA